MGPALQFPPQPHVRFDKIIEDIGLVYCALADRQRAAAFDIFWRRMQELLRQIDLEYYRSARLLIVRAKLQQLRQESLALANVERKKAAPRAGGLSSAGERAAAARLSFQITGGV